MRKDRVGLAKDLGLDKVRIRIELQWVKKYRTGLGRGSTVQVELGGSKSKKGVIKRGYVGI